LKHHAHLPQQSLHLPAFLNGFARIAPMLKRVYPVERPIPAHRRASGNGFFRSPRETCRACPSASWPLTDRNVLHGDLLFAPGPVALKRLHLGREGPCEFVKRAFGAVLMW
jgi:hypothetical protein